MKVMMQHKECNYLKPMVSKEMKVMLQQECNYLKPMVCKVHQQMELMLMECSYLNLKPMVCKLQVWLFSLLQCVVGQPIVPVEVCNLVSFSVFFFQLVIHSSVLSDSL